MGAYGVIADALAIGICARLLFFEPINTASRTTIYFVMLIVRKCYITDSIITTMGTNIFTMFTNATFVNAIANDSIKYNIAHITIIIYCMSAIIQCVKSYNIINKVIITRRSRRGIIGVCITASKTNAFNRILVASIIQGRKHTTATQSTVIINIMCAVIIAYKIIIDFTVFMVTMFSGKRQCNISKLNDIFYNRCAKCCFYKNSTILACTIKFTIR